MKQNFLPPHLSEKRNIGWLVLGTAIFAELFILIFRPFGLTDWFEGIAVRWRDWVFLGLSLSCVLVAMGFIAIARCILYQYSKKHQVQYWKYALSLFAELCAMSLVYALTVFFAYMTPHNIEISFFQVLLKAFGYTVCILSIPYVIMHLAFAYIAAKTELQELQESMNLGEEQPNKPTMIFNFRDEKGELRISIRAEDLFFVESADNYVIIHYRKNGDRIQKTALRKTLKKLEEEFMNTDLIRCHRSYMVNFQKIRMIQKTEDGLMIDFGEDAIGMLPISKTYGEVIMRRVGGKRSEK